MTPERRRKGGAKDPGFLLGTVPVFQQAPDSLDR